LFAGLAYFYQIAISTPTTIEHYAVHRPWREVKVTASRTALDFAACMRDLADVHFPKAARIRVVLDNQSTHSAGALHRTLPVEEARRLMRRLPQHDGQEAETHAMNSAASLVSTSRSKSKGSIGKKVRLN
jgi:hypothetical protein